MPPRPTYDRMPSNERKRLAAEMRAAVARGTSAIVTKCQGLETFLLRTGPFSGQDMQAVGARFHQLVTQTDALAAQVRLIMNQSESRNGADCIARSGI
jgi:hypothetical protein